MKPDIYYYALVFSLIVGPTQVVGGLVRLANVKHNSDYSNGLNRYFTLVVSYIFAILLATTIHNTFFDVEKLHYVFLPIVPICIALYYWRVIYSYDREEVI